MIGAKYKYYGSNKVFTLSQIYGFIYVFECGHMVTDKVFEDLIQITLF